MFEKNPNFDKPPVSENLALGLEEKEGQLIEDAVGVIHKSESGWLKKSARALAAFSVLMGASSAFAQEASEGKQEQPAQVEQAETKPAKRQRNEVAPFDWRSVVQKIEITAGGTIENSKFFAPETVPAFENHEELIHSSFYRDLKLEDYAQTMKFTNDAFRNTQNAQEFFSYLNANRDKLTDQQKALFMQTNGGWLAKTFNFSMHNPDKHVIVDDNQMYNPLRGVIIDGKKGVPTGICGNIHTFLTKMANAAGLEAWLQSGQLGKEGHIFSGFITETGGKKQIDFLNYGELIPTGTLNYKDAIGIWERYAGAVGTFNSYVGNTWQVPIVVKSHAQEVVEGATGVGDTVNRLEQKLSGVKENGDTTLGLTVSPEITKLKLDTDHFGVSVTHFLDMPNNPYQSLEMMTALSGNVHHRGEKFGIEGGVTVLHMNVKDFHGGSEAINEVITRVAADYVTGQHWETATFGEFQFNMGATLEAAVRLPIEKENLPSFDSTHVKKLDLAHASWMSEATTGQKLIWLDPKHVGKFWIGASENFRVEEKDFETQKNIIQKVGQTISAGAEIHVHEGQVLNIEAQKSRLDWGKSLNIKAGLTDEKLKAAVSYTKNDSNYERFIPSSTKIEASAGYQVGPKFRVDLVGAKTAEQYKGDAKRNIYNVEVRFTIFVW